MRAGYNYSGGGWYLIWGDVCYHLLFSCRCPSLPVMQKMMQDAGFKLGPALSLTHENLYKPHMLYNKEGPFLQEWRNGDR